MPLVYFTISADVSEVLRGKIISLSESAWKPLRRLTEKGLIEGRKEWAEVEFIPSAPSKKNGDEAGPVFSDPGEALAGELFSDGNSYHYYAVVTNRWELWLSLRALETPEDFQFGGSPFFTVATPDNGFATV